MDMEMEMGTASQLAELRKAAYALARAGFCPKQWRVRRREAIFRGGWFRSEDKENSLKHGYASMLSATLACTFSIDSENSGKDPTGRSPIAVWTINSTDSYKMMYCLGRLEIEPLPYPARANIGRSSRAPLAHAIAAGTGPGANWPGID